MLGEFGTHGQPDLRRRAWPAAQPDSGARPRPSTTPRSGAPTSRAAYYRRRCCSPTTPGAVSMRNFYIELSSNRYAVNGEVTDWVQVPFNEANYGANYCGSIVCSRTWLFVRDSLNAWYNAQIAAGQHAGSRSTTTWRSSTSGIATTTTATATSTSRTATSITSSRSTPAMARRRAAARRARSDLEPSLVRVLQQRSASTGPADNLGRRRPRRQQQLLGRRLHDRAGERRRRRVRARVRPRPRPARPVRLGRRQLDRLLDASCRPARTATTAPSTSDQADAHGRVGEIPARLVELRGRLRPGRSRATSSARPRPTRSRRRALFVVLPDKQVTTNIGAPFAGASYYYSGAGNNLDTRMSRAFTLPAGATLSAQVRYDIETDWDYAYWSSRPTAARRGRTCPPIGRPPPTPTARTSATASPAPPAASGSTLTANLAAYTGNVLVGFRYWTDGAVIGAGLHGRRHRDHRPGARRRRRPARLDVRAGDGRLPRDHRPRDRALLQHLRGRVPPVSRDVRLEPADRPVQLRVRQQPGAAQLRRAVSLSGRPAHQLLGHVAG